MKKAKQKTKRVQAPRIRFGSKTERYFYDNSMLGAWVPNTKKHKLSLFCLLTNQTRSGIIQKHVVDFIDGLDNEEDLILQISNEAVSQWYEFVDKNHEGLGFRNPKDFEEKWEVFKASLIERLNKAKIIPTHQEKILGYVESQLL